MEVLDAFYQPDVIDCWTVVLDERNPMNGCYTMLALDYDARMFSQFTEGKYAADGDNSHLGAQVCLIGKRLVEHVSSRTQDNGEEP